MNVLRRLSSVALVLLIFSIIFFAGGCRASKSQLQPESVAGPIKIYTTFYPLYDFTKKIAGDRAIVENLQPVGVEPHGYEPSPQQVASIYTGKLFIFLGEPMDPWAKKIEGQLKAKGVMSLEAGKGLIENNDPHIWLDPVLARELSRRIYEALVTLDADNKGYYEKNLQELEQKFTMLDKQYREVLAGVTRKDFVTSHAAFGYLAKRYGLKQIPISGLSPQEEPSAQQMAELITLCRSKGVKYIFFETLASPKLAETLARETGAGTLVLNPIGGLTPEEIKAGEDYFSIMAQNLASLKQALE
ncbi:Adhesion lipoprotein [Moorella glycerini]|uniref:High-affinity zinc uptake system binding-protein ZnuA n=1 Tax=Neomoorella stamsii TaxID=1266720 RepID=A0A9X7J0X7_9FIRM|nr:MULTISPECIES: metal ABC transporter substrate-binding protein [Moorella]PRR70354.1 High-affinity zinc uptake system binding-protein ZnuA precursor [Moorella stamsii]CEP66359.1 Adhesion lipoprotein [Moorella glycerini]